MHQYSYRRAAGCRCGCCAHVPANGDDLAGLDDEDGVSVFPALTTGGPQTFSITVNGLLNTTGSTATLYAWIDLDSDGEFEVGEFQSTTVANGFAGSKVLTWTGVTLSGSLTSHYLRVRLTTDALMDNGDGGCG
ncbi:MAG: hypothetical protein IPJ82_23540 [Lewinellaceae bacterium]|nr:hypothetical protein [Lewinellaceae bacterium]